MTTTIVQWTDLSSRKEQRDIIIKALKYCIAEKGLNVYAYCIMTNHIHMIVNCNEPFQLKDTIRDFKKFTSKAIVSEMKNGTESRRKWMLELFEMVNENLKRNLKYDLVCHAERSRSRQTGNHALELYSEKFTWEKVNYIHQNPVKAGFVASPEDWQYSSASNYAELEKLILDEVLCLTPMVITVK